MHKIVIGCVLQALSYVVIAWASWHSGGVRVSWLWLAAFSVLNTLGEIYLSPISMSLYSLVAPARIVSLMFAANFAPNFLGGGLLQGWLGTFWEAMSHPRFFLMIAAISMVSGVMLWMAERPLHPYLQKSHD